MDRHIHTEKPVDGWREYEGWAVSLTRSYSAHDIVDREDLVQVARIAVWQAWTRWDPAQGAFRPFASRYIVGALLRAYRDAAMVPAWRWERGERFLTNPIDDDMDVPAVEDPGFAAVDMDTVLDLLPPRWRTIVIRVSLAGHAIKDVAADLGAYPSQVTGWRLKAVAQLSEILDRASAGSEGERNA